MPRRLLSFDMLNPVIHITLNWLGTCEGSALCLLWFDTLYKGWREKSNAMLSWCPTGALLPGGNESRGGLLPVEFHV